MEIEVTGKPITIEVTIIAVLMRRLKMNVITIKEGELLRPRGLSITNGKDGLIVQKEENR